MDTTKDGDLLKQAEDYLRAEADYALSWIDGRRGGGRGRSEEYEIERRRHATTLISWADALLRARSKE